MTTHELCPFCGVSGIALFNKKKNGWKVECENRHKGCPINMRTHYTMSEEEAWKLWDTRT